MLRIILAAIVPLILIIGVARAADGTAAGGGGSVPETPCYECTGGNPCNDCWWPVRPGHRSCIPYCNGTCLVGVLCGAAFRTLELDADGSAVDDGIGQLVLTAPEVAPDGMIREVDGSLLALNCKGLVVARRYREAETAERLSGAADITL